MGRPPTGPDARRTLEPVNLSFRRRLWRGALAILPNPATGSPGIRLLRFQYNPETITRQRTATWSTRQRLYGEDEGYRAEPTGGENGNDKSDDLRQDKALTAAYQGEGLRPQSETLSFTVVFDSTENRLRTPANESVDDSDGVLPELSALEQIAVQSPSRENEASRDSEKLQSYHVPELVLLLGERRFPVVITSMTITEKRFNTRLVPVRAEVALGMRVLEPTEIRGKRITSRAYAELHGGREQQAAAATPGRPMNYEEAIERALQPRTVPGEGAHPPLPRKS